MYINEFFIQQYGIFSKQKVEGLHNGLNIMFGKNEAGKSTLLYYLRCMMCGIPQSRASAEYKRIPCIQDGFWGTMWVTLSSTQLVSLSRKYKADGRKENDNTLRTENGQPLDYTMWLDMLGAGIDLEVYRNIFGVSLSELVELSKDEQKVKDMLYGASIGAGIRPPSVVLQELEDKSKKIFTPSGGKNAIVNVAWEERKSVDEKRRRCLEFMQEYEELQNKSGIIAEEQERIDIAIKEQKERVRIADQNVKAYIFWKKIALLQHIPMHNEIVYTDDARDALLANDTYMTELRDELERAERAVYNKEEEIALLSYSKEVLEKEDAIAVLESSIAQYEHAVEESESIEKGLLQLKKEIDTSVTDIDSSFTRADVEGLSIHFAMEQEIASIKQEIHKYTNIAFHKEESIKELESSLNTIAHTIEQAEEEIKNYDTVATVEEILCAIEDRKKNCRTVEDKISFNKQSFVQALLAMPIVQWGESSARHNLLTMTCENIQTLKEYVTKYAEAMQRKEQLCNAKREADICFSIKHNECIKLEQSIENKENTYTQENMQTCERLEHLLYAREQLAERTNTTVHKIFASLVGIVCMLFCVVTASIIPFSVPVVQWISLSFGAMFSLGAGYSTFLLICHREGRKIYEDLKEKGFMYIDTAEEVEKTIRKLQKKLFLDSLELEEIASHKRTIQKYLDIENLLTSLRVELLSEREKVQRIVSEENKQEEYMIALQRDWERMLLEMSLPSIPLREDELEMLLRIRVTIESIVQEEEALCHELEQEKKHIQSEYERLEALPYIEAMQHNTRVYTEDALQELCYQYIRVMQKKKKVVEELHKEKENYVQKLAKARTEYAELRVDTLHERWQAWLKQSKFPQFLTPDTVESFIQRIVAIQQKIEREEQCIQQLENFSTKISFFKSSVQDVISSFPQKNIVNIYGLSPVESVRALSKILSQEKEKAHMLTQLHKEQREKMQAVEDVKERIHKTNSRIEEILKQAKCFTKEEFLQQYAIHIEYSKKRQEKEGYEKSLLELVYPRTKEVVFTLLENATEVELQEAVVKEQEILEELEHHKATLLEEVGITKEKLKQAEQGDISGYSLQHTMLTGKIENAMQEWYILRVAKEIILQAQRQFEEKYQPKVMRVASDILSTITYGAWNKVFRSAENTIKVWNSSNECKSPEELSRGTQEQMYLALRLAGACVHSSKTGEPLPLLLDDITVNFDDERRVGVARAIHAIAQGKYSDSSNHQIFLFTCHEDVAKTMYGIVADSRLFHLEQGTIQVH